jgi:hypothetical protein
MRAKVLEVEFFVSSLSSIEQLLLLFFRIKHKSLDFQGKKKLTFRENVNLYKMNF